MMQNANVGDRVRVKCRRVSQSDAAKRRVRKTRTFEFTVGSREVAPGLSAGVVEMAPGQSRRMTLQPEDAYGPAHPWLVREIARRRVPKDMELRVGKWLTHVEPVSGHRERVRIIEVKRYSIVVDANHPLAGKVVELDVMLVSVDSSSHANKSKQQFEMGGEG